MLVLIVPYVSANTEDDNSLPSHNGKCGDLLDSNMEEALKNCKPGDVVILQGFILPKYCDYRYQIVPYNENRTSQAYYSCVLRIERAF